jgi:hypothetical protein
VGDNQMSNKLFESFTEKLAEEIESQLSANALTVKKISGKDNALMLSLAEVYALSGRDIAMLRQINDIDKKYVGDESASDKSVDIRNLACWDTFVSANKRCLFQNANFGNLDSDVMATLELARNDIYKAFWEHAETENFEFVWYGDCNESCGLIPVSGFSTGPGSCTGVEGVSILEKYRGIWNVSVKNGKAFLHLLRRLSKPISDLPNFAVETVSAVYASFVPKNRETSRLIAPQLNGDLFLQYPAESCLRHMLKFMHISLDTQQDLNREYARLGSLHDNCDIFEHHLQKRRWRPCTIDLKSASDIIGTALSSYLMPPALQFYMESCRASNIKSEISGVMSSRQKLSMMATMGNAYCFPLQTIIFCAIVRAIYFRLGIPLFQDGKPTYGVYGDDIIVDITAYDHVIKILSALNMVPNTLKSFSHGFFRESCGRDCYRGYDVRPVMVESIIGDCGLYSLSNRLLLWGAEKSVCVSNSVSLLLGAVQVKTVVPMDFGTHTGLLVPEVALPLIPKHWKKNLVCASLIDRSFIEPFVIGGDWIGSRDNVVSKIIRRNIFSRTRIQTSYNSYSFVTLNRVAGSSIIRLSKVERSLFPFLRGGVSQSGDCTFAVTARGNRELRERRIVSLWDIPSSDTWGSAGDFWKMLSYYAMTFESLRL